MKIGEELVVVVTSMGLMTLFIARFRACLEWDSKKIVAFSTLRQLGLMVYRLGQNMVGLAFFHMVNHAIFKALMFIVVGYLILRRFHFQDIRFLRKNYKKKYFFFLVLMICVMSLRGFPYLVGFYSKDLIFERYRVVKIIQIVILKRRLLFTRYYRFRLLYYLGGGYGFKIRFIPSLRLFKVLRCVVLCGLIIVFGKRVRWMYGGISYIGVRGKVFILVLIFIGVYVVTYRIKYGRRWAVRKISYVNIIKTYIKVYRFRQLGVYYQDFVDLGILKEVKNFLKVDSIRLMVKNQIIYFKGVKVIY
jgi:NADH:ubiquinone oxidoreductase subunit 5 (subunit L)/multisubunit Na+/H+ antiporter MnhA subunit